MNKAPEKITPIRSVLKTMEIEDVQYYPTSRRNSVVTTRDQLQTQFPGKKWSISKLDDYTLKVVRIS